MNKIFLLLIFINISLFSKDTTIIEFLNKNTDVMFLINPSNGNIIKANKSASKFYGYSLSSLHKMNIKDINTFTKEQVNKELSLAKTENRNYFIFTHKLASNKIIKVVVHSYPITHNNKKLLLSIIHKQSQTQNIKEFNKRLEEQVKIQTKELEKSKSNITQIFTVSTIIFLLGISYLFYLLRQRDKLSKDMLNKNAQLKELNERFELAMNSSKDGLWDWNPKTNEVYFSTTWKKMLGYEDHEIKGSVEEWEKRIHPEDKEKAFEDVSNHLEGKTQFYENIHRVQHKKGHWVWIYDRGKAIFDKDNNPTRIIGFHTDLTAQKTIEKKIEDQKEEFKAIFENSMDGIAILDLDTKFLNFNDAYLKITSFTKEELLQKSCFELTIDEEKDKIKKALNIVMKKGHIENLEKSCIVKDESLITVNMSITLMPDKKRLLISMRDISKQKLIETQSKLISMGEMIGNISHQWRQPLTVISTLASSLLVKKECGILEENDIKDSSEAIVEQTRYLSHTIDDFRTFIKDSQSKEDLSLVRAINKTISLVSPSLKNNYIQLITHLDDDININGYENQLVQAFINIINNSKDALKENIADDENKLVFIQTKKVKDKLIITIKDNAKGIPQDILPRIFEPYFTTKHQNVGTGIGLSLANDILIKHHKARVKVINEEFEFEGKKQKGAVFIIEFKEN
ncbi:PAS domain S-box protein [Arcobacter roscoffensis]|uniref:histidine kinase n=1 Tax=Arcobacter roscoffensis TaxID=2961520 RepID=A0ABY5E427_9BACT|nr:PAS domain S-box protein [Arcobacter roscoffensis]UTJ06309.1 PAS domain S-box protein [Arcobacter roscoffensis]